MSRPWRSAASILAATLILSSVSGCGGAQARSAKHLEKGRVFLAAQNLLKARVEFQNALQLQPRDPQARLAMGIVTEKMGNYREAAQFYQGVIDICPDDPQALAHLAKFYLFRDDPKHAMELIDTGLGTHPDDPGLLTVRAAARVESKDYESARADAERAVASDPGNEEAVQVLAGILMNQQRSEDAIALLERSLQRVDGINLRLVLAQIYIQLDRKADAEAQLIKIVALEPRVFARRLALAQSYSRWGQADAAETTLRKAVADLPDQRAAKLSLVDFLLAQRGRDMAEHELKTMISVQPADAELKFALARFYAVGGERDKAEGIYAQVIADHKLDPAGLTARNQLAALRLQVNDSDRALFLVNEVLAKSPRDDDALALRGGITLSRQDPRSAIADLRTVLRDQPNAPGVLRTLAQAHLANGEPALAEEIMRHAVEANPSGTGLKLELAQLLARQGKPDQAAAILAGLVKLKPDDVDALADQFRLALRMHDMVTAKTAADAVVASRPTVPLGYLLQGAVAEEDRRSDEALRLYAHAVDLNPGSEESLTAYVRTLAAANRVAEALKRLDDLAAKYPQAALALDLKGQLLLDKGRATEAEASFRQAIARAPKAWHAYQGLARAQAALRDPAAAIDTLQNAEPSVDRPLELTKQRAALLESSGKTEDAIQTYDQLVHREPQSDELANSLALLLATYRHDEASFEHAAALSSRFAHSENPIYLDTYGWVLLKRGNAVSAVPVLSQVVARIPDAIVPRFHLGMAQSLSGNESDARTNLTRVVKSGVHFYGFDEAKATLDRLNKSTADAASRS